MRMSEQVRCKGQTQERVVAKRSPSALSSIWCAAVCGLLLDWEPAFSFACLSTVAFSFFLCACVCVLLAKIDWRRKSHIFTSLQCDQYVSKRHSLPEFVFFFRLMKCKRIDDGCNFRPANSVEFKLFRTLWKLNFILQLSNKSFNKVTKTVFAWDTKANSIYKLNKV